MSLFSSSNPVLNNDDAFQEFYGSPVTQRKDVASFNGIVNKTAILILIALVCGAGAYAIVPAFPALGMISMFGAFLIAIGLGFFMVRNPAIVKVVAPIYAVVEGAFLGCATRMADNLVAGTELAGMTSIGLSAFIVTGGIFMTALILYRTGLVRATPFFKKFMAIAIGGMMFVYLINFILSLFGLPLPFVSFYSAATETGAQGLIGLGVNLLMLGVASFALILDFDRAEQIVDREASKDMEWFAAYGLLVTLAWIYWEVLKMLIRIAMIFGSRD